MGAWGIETLENDSAMDFVADYEQFGVSALVRAIAEIRREASGGYVEVDGGAAALVVGEVVAAAFGAPSDAVGEFDANRLATHAADVRKHPELVVAAIEAIKLSNGDLETSENLGLWSEAGELEQFITIRDELVARLEGLK
ncbi:DUF4259 domain-containing protein [Loktanella sp. IMCC34160]|uniref:DUF4259 domain-containing protein n=1 Tax=Loktanella sp. IMCC34160 TaxID=2510646 RepID=UPI002413DF5E|nr:DUF4259 domain-containing protein [Loktanella sp. IMCC34160]